MSMEEADDTCTLFQGKELRFENINALDDITNGGRGNSIHEGCNCFILKLLLSFFCHITYGEEAGSVVTFMHSRAITLRNCVEGLFLL